MEEERDFLGRSAKILGDFVFLCERKKVSWGPEKTDLKGRGKALGSVAFRGVIREETCFLDTKADQITGSQEV